MNRPPAERPISLSIFFPAYYEDNDYARRAMLAGVLSCTAMNGIYFHFWSRTIKQGSGGSTDKYFQENKKFYQRKWGGDFLSEKYQKPFGGEKVKIAGQFLPDQVLIDDRSYEKPVVKYWRK